tara:strand:+ start:7289 stop:7882 length:594 start_codon:yes stop_codon:yes gene_type:complete
MQKVDLQALKVDYVLEKDGYQLINYCNLSQQESLKLLAIRNNPSIRTRMVNSDLISEENHLHFLLNLPNQDVGYWALKRQNEILGSISLVEFNEADLSFIGGNFIAPKMIGGGFGAVVNYYMHFIAFEKIKCRKVKAIVKKDNINAIRINKLFGAVISNENDSKDEISNDYKSLEFYADNWANNIKEKSRKIIEYVL